MIDSVRSRTPRRTATVRPAVAPIARAIRTALTVSTLALTMAAHAAPAGQPLVAGCVHESAWSAACDTGAGRALQHDPSLVADAAPPSAVYADGSRPAGTTDIVHDTVTDVVSAGDALGLGASDDIVRVHNTGTIGAHGVTSAIGIDVSGADLTVVNDGSLFAEAVHDGTYTYAPAIGIRAFGESVDIGNGADGSIDVYANADGAGSRARARGVYAVAFGGEVLVDNQGDIDALAIATGGRAEAHGVYAFGYGGPTTVTNAGDIDSHAVAVDGRAYATGINAIGYGSGDSVSSVVNTGSIDALAEGDNAYAFGIFNLTRQRDGSATTDNSGAVHAEATGNAATVNAIINLALRYGDASLVNSGDVDAVANGGQYAAATGLYNHAYVYNSDIDNSGDVNADASGDFAIAVGVYGASGLYGDSTVDNSGSISARASGDATQARAAGIAASSEHSVAIANHGDVVADATTIDGAAIAVGLYAIGTELATIHNYADVSATAATDAGGAYAYGAMVFAGQVGIGVLVNGGDLFAEATATGGMAYAVGGLVYAEVGSIFNDGSATAIATATGGNAVARGARVYSMYGLVENAGTLDATAIATGGDAVAIGADSFGYFGSTVDSAGDIDALAMADGGDAIASGIYSMGVVSSSYVNNTGTIHAEAHGDSAVANGTVSASLYYGHGVTTNSGDVTAIAVGGIADYGEVEATAFGLYNFALLYSSVVENSGTVTASAQALADITIEEGLVQAQALGIAAINQYGVFDTAVYNTGDVAASAEVSLGLATAWGIAAQSTGYYGGLTIVENSGEVSAYAHAEIGVAEAFGVYAANFFTGASVVNHGDILAVADTQRGIVNQVVNYAYATGVQVYTPYGVADVANYGDITAVAQSYGAINGARGMQVMGDTVDILNATGATINALGDAQVFGGGFATGIDVSGNTGINLVNDGTINVQGHAQALIESEEQGFYGASVAIGIYAVANVYGNIGIVNNGDIFATALTEHGETFFQAGAGATGVHAYAKYDATIVNNGRIVASATSDLGITGAYGMVGEGKYSSHIVNHGDVIATATVGSQDTDSYGGRSSVMALKVFNSDHASIVNDGLVVAHATSTANSRLDGPTLASSWGATIGYNSTVLDGIVDNSGTIESVARADFGYATAYGSFVDTVYDSATVNSGDILAAAIAVQGDAWTVGALGRAIEAQYIVPCDENGCDYGSAYFITVGGDSHLDNSGAITALADAEGGIATAYGTVQIGGLSAGIVNGGDVLAVATADEAAATGALANSILGAANVDNGGLVGARATGASATATGVFAMGGTDVSVGNSGTVVAGAYGAEASATAVSMTSTGTNRLHNTGTISALGDGERIAVWSGDGAIADLDNAGTLVGAIRTGDLGDRLVNGGTWFALGSSTFGAGDDVVGSSGTIVLDDSTIAFGGDAGDAFSSTGGLVVHGDGNLVDVGTGLFANDGWISLVDGASNDVLAVTGTFAGTGRVQLDVDALAGTADLLAIAGDVDAAAVQSLDLNVVSRPESEDFEIGLVTVSGDSVAGNFVLGDIAVESGFVTFDFDLRSTIDASNATDDVFSLGVAVSGLNANGKLAAALSPGVQSLVDAQVGTWRQRMGVLPRTSDGGPDAWVRAFSSSGDIDAAHSGLGDEASLAIDQSSHGWEVGVDLALNERVSVGMLVGDSEATSRLGEAGSNRLDATTFGLYATWQSANGFYVDASQRWTGVDAELRGPVDRLATEVDADTFNLEAGFTAWTVGGFGVTPQLQYTHTRIGDVSPLHAGASIYEDDGGISSRGRLGVMFDRTFESGSFLLTPYASLNAVHEFDGSYDHAINGGVTGTTSIEGTAALVELGLGARNGGFSVTGGVNWTDGDAQDGIVGGQLSLRYAW